MRLALIMQPSILATLSQNSRHTHSMSLILLSRSNHIWVHTEHESHKLFIYDAYEKP
ncbi:MAG: hypothetical protein G01um101448_877 [Parcubacteria group bacterium Gr01-1014_48]|nr:MAG: hypothetical protein Greene041614_1192 [Parcubacteria group bacterium Greene0416_14]TSC72976.1 MAG: hypothetical protein G01um101448_877 [Parcubacteria group bacterium Gr01-1014_48]TSC99096.1 MAG: hypothetical protein Greene101415_1200 [Parcubacteria group bacterium Greene1014_15]TSD06969.1 MAG: hypothetical protein Greene07144_1044 [Parcubacteria group bacterium Greene0714_4]